MKNRIGCRWPSAATLILSVLVLPACVSVTLTADRSTLTKGESVTLNWSATSMMGPLGPRPCNQTARPQEPQWNGRSAGNGTQTVTPNDSAAAFTQVYEVECTNVAGQSGRGSVTVSVQAPPAATVQLSAQPVNVTVGDTITLTWQATGTRSGLGQPCTRSATPTDPDWRGPAPATGQAPVIAKRSSSGVVVQTFTLTCEGPAGTAPATRSVTVNVSAPPPPTVTLTVDRADVQLRDAAVLRWSTAGVRANAPCTASTTSDDPRDAATWRGVQAASGQSQLLSPSPGRKTYALTCEGPGGSTTATVDVNVQGFNRVRLALATGGDDLRDNSTGYVLLGDLDFNLLPMGAIRTDGQPVLPDPSAPAGRAFKNERQAGWARNSSHEVTIRLADAQPLTALGNVQLGLVSHNAFLQANDVWHLQSATIDAFYVADPMEENLPATPLCSQRLAGQPLAQITDTRSPVRLDTPNCQPPIGGVEPVACKVFDDGNSNPSASSDVIFIDAARRACIPDGTPGGTCRRWFGDCTSASGQAVTFEVFDDNYTNRSGRSGAVFINGSGQACIPDGTAQGTCRKWFGRGLANGRPMFCRVLDDGDANLSNRTDAVTFDSAGRACGPGTGYGICTKWWGRCELMP